jgi:hypothetical protein
MKKKTSKPKKVTALGLQTETLRRLDDSQMQAVAGGARVRIPINFTDDTTPIYDDGNG